MKNFLFSVVNKGMGSTWNTSPVLCIILFPVMLLPFVISGWFACTGSYTSIVTILVVGAGIIISCLLCSISCWIIDILANIKK